MHVRTASVLASIAAFALAPSARADAKSECNAAFEQGQQTRDDGKYHTARESFLACSRPICPKVMVGLCTKWSREVDESMPTIVLAAKDSAGADVSDARVTADGTSIATSLDGKPIEIDPGSHKLRFEREGSDPVEQTVVIKAGEKLRNIRVTLKSGAPVAVDTTAHHDEDKPHMASGGGDGAHVATTIAFGVLAAGGLIGGIAFGFASQGDADSAAALRSGMPASTCVGAGGATQPCQDLSNAVDAQNRDGVLSITMYVVSGVFAAATLITWFAWPKAKTEHSAVSARFLFGPGFAGIGGKF